MKSGCVRSNVVEDNLTILIERGFTNMQKFGAAMAPPRTTGLVVHTKFVVVFFICHRAAL